MRVTPPHTASRCGFSSLHPPRFCSTALPARARSLAVSKMVWWLSKSSPHDPQRQVELKPLQPQPGCEHGAGRPSDVRCSSCPCLQLHLM